MHKQHLYLVRQGYPAALFTPFSRYIAESKAAYRIPKAHLLTYLIGFAPGHAVRA